VVVKIPKNDKHKEYARYAAHCLQMVTAAKDPKTRSIQRDFLFGMVLCRHFDLARSPFGTPLSGEVLNVGPLGIGG
jgi:hypothetical protein